MPPRARGRTGPGRGAQLVDRQFAASGMTVGTLGGDGVVCVADRDHARGKRDLLATRGRPGTRCRPGALRRADGERNMLETLGGGDDPLADRVCC